MYIYTHLYYIMYYICIIYTQSRAKCFFTVQGPFLSLFVLYFCFFISFGLDRCRQINSLNFSLPFSPLDLLCILFWKEPWASTLLAHGLFIADGS